MRHVLFSLGACWFIASMATAQEAPATVIETEGRATVFASPTFADFWLHAIAAKETVIEGMNEMTTFEMRVREALAARALTPNDIEVRAPAIADVNEAQVTIAARLRFNMSNFASIETGPQQFAALCDKLADLGKGLELAVEGPIFTVHPPDTMVRSAVAKATEQAYPAAEAIATELKTTIYAVSAVSVIDIVWNQAEEVRGVQPTLRQVSCTARVRVVYEVASTP